MLGSMVGMIGRMVRRTGQSVLGKVLGWVTGHGGTVLLDAATDVRAPEVTFSRADQAMVCDEAGNWTWTALPYRRSYDVQTKEWGYLFEPQRTNLFTNMDVPTNNQGVFAAASSPAVLYGLPARTTIATAEWQSNLTADGKTYTASICINNQSVSAIYVMWLNASGWVVLDSKQVQPGESKRVSVTQSLASGTAVFYVSSTNSYSGSASIPVGVTIGGAQLETGAVATSPIATNGAQVTVAADVCTYQNNVLTDAAGSVLARSACAGIVESSILGYSSGADAVLHNRSGQGYRAIFPGMPASVQTGSRPLNTNQNTGMVTWGGSGVSVTDAGAEATGVYTNPALTPVLRIGQANDAGARSGPCSINHLSVFPAQLDAATRAEAVQLFN